VLSENATIFTPYGVALGAGDDVTGAADCFAATDGAGGAAGRTFMVGAAVEIAGAPGFGEATSGGAGFAVFKNVRNN